MNRIINWPLRLIYPRNINVRNLRTRALVSQSSENHFVVTNPKTSANWPPIHDHGSPMTKTKCKLIMHQLRVLEQHRLTAAKRFHDSTNFCSLQGYIHTCCSILGYCIELRNRGLNSSFRLKNVLDGVGVEQHVPLYSPRLLHVKVLKPLSRKVHMEQLERPITRDYRYKFHRNVRHRFAAACGIHKPGIRNFESRLKNRIRRLKNAYYQQRLEAGLPPYVWGGAYNVQKPNRAKLVRAETNRRIQIYSMDEQTARTEKLHKRREKSKWGVYKLPGTKYIESLETRICKEKKADI
ncbi:bifunctional Ribosomal protein L19/Ribosomal protein L19 superfamily/Translation protein SH3-like domain superfamily [Babesia duncani]|uniref:50S ribosomal protein L19, chloroplastic n=1 Tax=Babesia duncani TaxID=323732 RepID=A0AAD9PP95_9APIC|nr:bifunctional Ribosomal protein L19/Ribosomal protein L19 superfamily/Translation protein SH3-like domain superfamily [Babesia duncani]